MSRAVYIIAEAGSNWRMGTPARDRAMGRALIDAAAAAGADAVKFQTYRPETVYVPNAGESDYLAEAGIKESIVDIFRDLSMPYEMIPDLARACAEKKIEFLSTPFSIADAKALDPHVRRFKIASYEITHLRLIEYAARSGKPLLLSTGAATIRDIEIAVDHFRECGGRDLTLLQCTARYPAPLSALNLSVIPELARRFQVPVGFSDHSREPLIGPLAATAMGAAVIEKHFTLDNRLPGPDHAFAVTAEELRAMVQAVRACEATAGSGIKEVLPEERELCAFAQRGIQAIKPVAAGDVLREGVNIDILRPGKRKKGIHPVHLPEIEGRKATRAIGLGDGIQSGDYA